MLQFNLDVDVDIAATDVREKLDLIKADFPKDAEDPRYSSMISMHSDHPDGFNRGCSNR